MASAEPERETAEGEPVSPTGSTPPVLPPAAFVLPPTAADTLRHDEWLRIRRFVLVVLGLIALGALTLPLFGGDRDVRTVVYACMGPAALSCIGFLIHARDESRYTATITFAAGLPMIPLLVASLLFFGPFSPMLTLIVVTIYFFGLSHSRPLSFGLYLVCAVVEGVLVLLTTMGVLPDDALVTGGRDLRHRLLLLLLVEVSFLVTYLFGRLSRRATLSSVQGLERALRQISQRDALLEEANQDLERALQAGRAARPVRDRVGPWLLGELIGRGAMGDVYRARHAERDQNAAVKLLAAERETEPRELRRFLREAEVMSQLESPHVVAVYDAHDGSAGPPYIAMELLDGHDLAWYLRKQRVLTPRATVELVSQVAAALEQARTRSIVHRDLKPQNLFHARAGGDERLWKVLDFGISSLGGLAGTMTRGRAVGTPGYMAPEQARGGDVDHRADVFSLAVIAYRALTGRPAFTGEDYPKVMFNVVYTQPLRAGELTELPADVDLVLAIGLAKDAGTRFETAIALAEALSAAAKGELSPTLRERARALLAAAPWGQRVR